MTIRIVTIEDSQAVEVERTADRFAIEGHDVEVLESTDQEAILLIDGRTVDVPFLTHGGQVTLLLDGEVWTAEVSDKGSRTRTRNREQSMQAPMPGVVLKILVAPGDVVTKGTPMLILEAMKMEHAIVAPRDGIVARVACAAGELVQPGKELIELNAEAAETSASPESAT